MKAILFIALFSVIAYAQNPQQQQPNFGSTKQLILTNIDQRMSALQSFKSCAEAATDTQAMKACRLSHKTAVAALKIENHGERSVLKAARQARKVKKI